MPAGTGGPMLDGGRPWTGALGRGRELQVEITGLITAIVFGAAIGGLGRLVAPGRHRLSLFVTILVGIVAAVAGTGVAGFIGVADTGGIDWIEIALQVVFAAGGVTLLSGMRARQYSD
jgi:uncharacterized membrane protein YeaQ/YmgE (transglycosylase-associated protein family)